MRPECARQPGQRLVLRTLPRCCYSNRKLHEIALQDAIIAALEPKFADVTELGTGSFGLVLKIRENHWDCS